MEIETIVLLIAGFLFSIITAYFQYLYKIKEKSQLDYWLSFLRMLSLFSIVFLLVNPTYKNLIISTTKPNLIVAVDNSSSIKFNNQSSTVLQLLKELKENSELNSKFNLNYFSFGTSVKVLDTLAFNESKTAIEAPLNEISLVFKDNVSPTILITDGNQTIGKSVLNTNFKNPLYPFIVGDTTKVEDIYINQLNVNKFTYINNQFPVEVFINYNGTKTITKQLAVYHNKQKILSKNLQFSSIKSVVNESFFIEGKESGLQNYSVKIEELEKEKNVLNNSNYFSVDVIKEQSKILILSSIIHPDLGFFKKSIESNKQRTVSIYTIENFKGKLEDYELVILYQPNNKFKTILSTISNKSINYLLVTGLKTDWNFLNSNQTIVQKNVTTQVETYKPLFNSSYSTYQINDIGFKNFEPLDAIFGAVKITIPHSIIFHQKIGAIETQNPLLATFSLNNQKGALLFGENSWRWRMNSYLETKSFEQFDGFMANLIQYLTINKSSNRLSVFAESMYYSNDLISISANYLDNNYVFDERAKLWITVSNKENGFIKKIPFSLNNSSFNAEFVSLAEGDYNYAISVENQKETFTGKFTVLPFEIEQQTSTSNDKDLIKVSEATNGAIFYNDQGKMVIDKLLSDNQYKSIQKSTIEKTPLIEFKWVLVLIVLLLSIEWFVRKYYGRI